MINKQIFLLPISVLFGSCLYHHVVVFVTFVSQKLVHVLYSNPYLHWSNDDVSGDEVSVKYRSNIKPDVSPADHFKNHTNIDTRYGNDIYMIVI